MQIKPVVSFEGYRANVHITVNGSSPSDAIEHVPNKSILCFQNK